MLVYTRRQSPLEEVSEVQQAKPKPYIGVTGVFCPQDVESLLEELKTQTIDTGLPLQNVSMTCLKDVVEDLGYGIAVGMLVSDEIAMAQNKHPHLFPHPNYIGEIIDRIRPPLFPVLHYCTENADDFFSSYTNIEGTIYSDNPIDGPNNHNVSVQLNIDRPRVSEVRDLRQYIPKGDRRIILQLSKIPSDKSLQIMLDDYRGFVTDVLIDQSRGRGRIIDDLNLVIKTVRFITEEFPEFGVGIAGGLDSEQLQTLKMFFFEFANLSIDAQSGLLTQSDNPYLRVFDPTSAVNFIRSAIQAHQYIIRRRAEHNIAMSIPRGDDQ